MIRPQTETIALLAFVMRCPHPVAHYGELTTDGITLKERDTVIAAWTDETRIVIDEGAPKAVDRFLEYWGCFYHIGVTRRRIEPGELDERDASLLEEQRSKHKARAEMFVNHIAEYAKSLRKATPHAAKVVAKAAKHKARKV
jgi:hypothetical protein